jgi:hypothetical protein
VATVDATADEVFIAGAGGIALMMLVAIYGPPQPTDDQFALWLLAMIAMGGAAGGLLYSLLQTFKSRRY